MKPRYRRILLKLSGEALAGSAGFGIDSGVCAHIASEILEAHNAGVQMGIVIGGGNFFRGLGPSARGFDRTVADTIGMLATLMNSLALKEFFRAAGIPVTVMSANTVQKAVETYTPENARRYLENGTAVIVAGGTGNPYFTTDTAAALRCAELKAEVLLKATKVDGIYDSDPVKNPDAVKIDVITHHEALRRNLGIMDMTAFSFCMENDIPIIVFKLLERGNLRRCIEGSNAGSMVTKGV